MKRLILFILIFISFQIQAQNIAWKIQDSLSYSSVKSLRFSENGDTLVAINGEHLIFLNTKTGAEIKRLNSKSLFLISDDYCFGLTKNKYTLYVISIYTGDTISSFPSIKYDSLWAKQNLVFSRDSKLIIQSISYQNWMPGLPNLKYKSHGIINIIKTSSGEIIKTLFDTSLDSLGFVDCLFFDKIHSNEVYFSGNYLNIDSINSLVHKKVYRYNLTTSELDTIYSRYYEVDEEGWGDDIEIFPASPNGCAMDVSNFWNQFKILYPGNDDLIFHEGFSISPTFMIDSYTFLWLDKKHLSDYTYLKILRAAKHSNAIWFNLDGDEIDKYINPGRILVDFNKPNNLIAVSLSKSSEIIMYIEPSLTSVNNSRESQNLEISPNPASDYIEINIDSRGVNPSAESIRIFDLLGTEMQSTSVSYADTPAGGGQVRIDISSLQPGVYFVRIGNEVRKFVKL